MPRLSPSPVAPLVASSRTPPGRRAASRARKTTSPSSPLRWRRNIASCRRIAPHHRFPRQADLQRGVAEKKRKIRDDHVVVATRRRCEFSAIRKRHDCRDYVTTRAARRGGVARAKIARNCGNAPRDKRRTEVAKRSNCQLHATEIMHGTFIEDRRCPGVEIGARSLGRRGAVRPKHLLKRANESSLGGVGVGVLASGPSTFDGSAVDDRSKRISSESRARRFPLPLLRPSGDCRFFTRRS